MGFRLGLERAGHTVAWANEWDKYAADTYDKNFNKDGQNGISRADITTIDPAEIPAHDLIVGGFPCQAFSVAGKRRGFDETRGTLFFEILRIARHHRTRYLLLENVKGLLNHDRGRTFGVMLRALDESGYDVQWEVLNSKNFGVPQNRERVFIVGHLRGEPRPQIFPIGGDHREAPGAGGPAQGWTPAIRANYAKNPGDAPYIKSNGAYHQNDRCYDPDGIAPAVQARTDGRGGTGAQTKIAVRGITIDTRSDPQVRPVDVAGAINSSYHTGLTASHGQRTGVAQAQRITDTDGVAPTLSITDGGGAAGKPMIVDLKSLGSDTRRGVVKDGYTGALDGDGKVAVTIPSDELRIRRLTPIECERLQGFPDNWTAGVSDTQRYKQMGNAVTVNVVEAIARQLAIEPAERQEAE